MTKRDFFIVAIKLFGLYMLVGILFSFLPHTIPNMLMYPAMGYVGWAEALTLMLVSAAIMTGLFVLLVFKAGKVVSILRLDKGFDDQRVELGDLKPVDIIGIGTFIIGGILFVENITVFLSDSYYALKGDMAGMEYSTQENVKWGVSGLNVILGYLLMAHHGWIANKLKR